MLAAALAGIGAAELIYALKIRPNLQSALASGLPLWAKSPNALDVFSLFKSAALAICYARIGALGSAIAWGLALTWFARDLLRRLAAQRGLAFLPPAPPTGAAATMRVAFICMALVFIAVPVALPWSGPAEPFVRWHPYSPPVEIIWRALFLSFALAMLAAARDPVSRNRRFLAALGISSALHAIEMAADNLIAANTGGANGNPQHLIGDISAWLFIATLSIAILATTWPHSAHIPD
jgi:hypothetical protein